jgi:hypothetical protein
VRLVAFDLETHVVQPGLRCPPVVVGSICEVEVGDSAGEISAPRLLWPADDAIDALVQVLEDPSAVLVAINAPFDLACAAQHALSRGRDIMPLVHQALEDGRVFDPRLVEKLHAIGKGHLGKSCHQPWLELPGDYGLDVVVEQVLGEVDAKSDDEYQLRYHELEYVPINRRPEKSRRYPLADVRNPLRVALAQLGYAPRRGRHEPSRCGRPHGDPAGDRVRHVDPQRGPGRPDWNGDLLPVA